MNREAIEVILHLYGLERILEDFELDIPEVLEILNELGYINFDFYLED